MTELEKAVESYKDLMALSNLDLDEVPKSVRAGRESQKREAQSGLHAAKEVVQANLKKALFGICVKGDVEAFVAIATEEAECLVVDADAMYRRISNFVGSTMGDRQEFGVSQFAALIQELRQIGTELKLGEMPSPRWTEPVSVGNQAGLFKQVKTMVESATGIELLARYVTSQIVDAAIASGVAKNTVPVILKGEASEALLNSIFQEGRTLTTTLEGVVTKEVVLEVFSKVKKQLKSKTTKGSTTNE